MTSSQLLKSMVWEGNGPLDKELAIGCTIDKREDLFDMLQDYGMISGKPKKPLVVPLMLLDFNGGCEGITLEVWRAKKAVKFPARLLFNTDLDARFLFKEMNFELFEFQPKSYCSDWLSASALGYHEDQQCE